MPMLTWGFVRSNLLFAIAVVLFVLEPLKRQHKSLLASGPAFMPKRNGEPPVDDSLHAKPLGKIWSG
ncbi:hypothetical protein F9K88_03410 [Brucella intermedia]|nr:hypothetical protein F9K72_02170 [Brucella intermedia]PJR94454.1 hypothetical protein CN881_02275 [Ochrobactrum sp. 721/2009]PJT17738.1 hypothetical protein CN880_03740 [Ochrobactrum sp. 720/2009]PJT21133.1 hypothetical protein CN879_16820 [Ochrobactrum sp. 715/2009]PJT27175.1 hypothetical protein CN884_01860 [Ochrobactrum sp. 30A/1000/2015]PJT31086.1 hypothetical protein CN878_07010 [Ochrobactrum sp. 695/2009]PJT33100.1 hypothetical protein CN877_16945 [Ochrobactrum sp. 689/2009]PJT38597